MIGCVRKDGTHQADPKAHEVGKQVSLDDVIQISYPCFAV